MNWCFATINGRLGEIYFDRKKNGKVEFRGHCYVKRTDFRIKGDLCYLHKTTSGKNPQYSDKALSYIKAYLEKNPAYTPYKKI